MNLVEKSKQASEVFYSHLELFKAKNLKEWINLWSDDAVAEFPYAISGSDIPSRIEGKSAIFDFFKEASKDVEFFAWIDCQIYQTLDPETIFAEFQCEGKVVKTGRPYNQMYCCKVQLNDSNKIAFYKEYWNPMVVQEAFNMTNN